MDAELTALATAGATALVQQMVTESWAQARRRVVAFLARRHGAADEEVLEGELEESRADIVAARQGDDEEEIADVTAVWRRRLRRLLRDDPAAAAELRALLDELQPPQESGGTVREVHNNMNGAVHHGVVIQAGVVNEPRFGGAAPGSLPG